MNEKKAKKLKELLKIAETCCLYTDDRLKPLKYIRLALALLDEPCQTCGGSGEIPLNTDGFGGVCGAAFEIAQIKVPCPDCPTSGKSGEFRQKVTCALLDCRSDEQQLKVALELLHESEDHIERLEATNIELCEELKGKIEALMRFHNKKWGFEEKIEQQAERIKTLNKASKGK